MQTIKPILLMTVVLLTSLSFASFAKESVFDVQAQSVLSEWFSVDPKHLINMQQNAIDADELGERFNLNFTSDDQQTVNGILAMPVDYDSAQKPAFKLALLLHPMGTDHTLWFSHDNPINAENISIKLRKQGFAVLALDARRHGDRKVGDIGLKDLIERAHSPYRRLYDDMIIGTVRDYRLALAWMKSEWDLSDTDIAAVGYSMGAQMALLLASYEQSISYIISMVPPYIDQTLSPVAPRHHVSRISAAKVLYLAAKQDPYSTEKQSQYVFELIGSKHKSIRYFEGGHVLPAAYLETVMHFIDENMTGDR
ncbi:MAG: dienelactone hydrolase family protein [Xanthomonadales bacterium]|nr:dienelactone hydrolase family protein [Xanthomonadales bacterium]